MSAAAIIIVRVNRILTFLRDRGAVTPELAVAREEVPYSNRWYFERLVKYGAIRIHEGKCYLDVESADRFVRNRRRRVLGVLTATILLFLVYLLLAGMLN